MRPQSHSHTPLASPPALLTPLSFLLSVLRSQELAADMSHLFGHYGAGSEDRKAYVPPPAVLQALTGEAKW